MINTTDLMHAVSLTLGDHAKDYNIAGIAEVIQGEYPEAHSIDDVPTDDYWEIVKAYDGSDPFEGQE